MCRNESFDSAKIVRINKFEKDLATKDDINGEIGVNATGLERLFARRFPDNYDTTELVVACRPDDFSASMISRAVEDCNAHVLNLNVTSERLENGEVVVDLRVDHRTGDHIARSLERYGYTVLDYAGANDETDDSAKERAAEILRILNI